MAGDTEIKPQIFGNFQKIGQQNDIKKSHRCRALLLISVPKLAIAGRRLAGYDSIVTSHCPALD